MSNLVKSSEKTTHYQELVKSTKLLTEQVQINLGLKKLKRGIGKTI